MTASRFTAGVAGVLAIAAIVSVSSVLAAAQAPASSPAPAAATPRRAGKVFLSGENPWIFLNDKPGSATTLTQVSFWRIHWSPAGSGHVCFVTSGALRVALYDNRKLLDYLTNDVLGTYNKAYLDRPFTPVGDATFTAGGDSITERRERCKAAGYDIELIWRDLREPVLNDVLAGSRTTNPFGITWMQMSAGRAEVRINGTSAPGISTPEESFLAFGETWLK